MDVIEVISGYLRDNRRLVVPTFGAFVVKESGEVLFSELLKTDDWVLRGLLAAEGLSELECAGVIDRFIFDARNALSESGRFGMGDMGWLALGGNGEMTFVSRVAKQPEKPIEETPVKKQVAVAPKVSFAPETGVSQPDTNRPEVRPVQRSETAVSPRRREPKRRGTDWFMIIAVAVLLAAVAVIAYGYFCSTEQDDEAMMDSLRWQIEQTAAPDNE